ncbi:protein of unknown function DUF21 [Candidatus Kryptonium thompsonii]|nr:protein of unknown function DUF21 [Candidatus Kryptonium thompsoni]
MQVEIVLAFILLSLSAFFSASEIAFISANKIKLEIKSQKSLTAKIANEFAKKPETFLITILIGNNFVNIALSSILTFVLKTSANSNDFTILILIQLYYQSFHRRPANANGRSLKMFQLFPSYSYFFQHRLFPFLASSQVQLA